MNTSTLIPGRRVRLNTPDDDETHGRIGRIDHVGPNLAWVDLGPRVYVVSHDDAATELEPVARMSLPARTLLAAWHASDRKLDKLSDHVCGLHRIRRYAVIGEIGSAVDLTLTTEVQR
jgi:hypothetical protein